MLRNGTPRISGLNEPLPGEGDDLAGAEDGLGQLALQWAEPGHRRNPDDVQFMRAETSLECIVAMVASAANTREHGLPALSEAYLSIAQLRVEKVKSATIRSNGRHSSRRNRRSG